MSKLNLPSYDSVVAKLSCYIAITLALLEKTVGHWPFSDQFCYLAGQNKIYLAKFTV